MALENHMAEVARLVGEHARDNKAVDGLQLMAIVDLPLAEQPDGTPYRIGAKWTTPAGLCDCVREVSTATPAHAVAAQMVNAIGHETAQIMRSSAPDVGGPPPQSTGELGEPQGEAREPIGATTSNDTAGEPMPAQASGDPAEPSNEAG